MRRKKKKGFTCRSQCRCVCMILFAHYDLYNKYLSNMDDLHNISGAH